MFRFQADNNTNQNPVVCLEYDHQVDANREEEEEEASLYYPISRKNDDQNRAETEDSDQNRAETEDSYQNRTETEDSGHNIAETEDSGQHRAETEDYRDETEDSGFVETVSTLSTDLYEYTSGRVINGYMEEPKAMSFIVRELYVDWGSSKISDYQIPNKTSDGQEKGEDSVESVEALANEEDEKPVADQNPLEKFNTKKVPDAEIELGEVEGDDCSVVSDSRQDPVSSTKDHDVGSLNYEFLIYRNVGQRLEPQSFGFQYDEGDHIVKFDMEDDQFLDVSIPDGKAIVFSDQSDDSESSDEEYIELLEPQLRINSQQLEEVENKAEDKEELVQDETQATNTIVQSAEEESGLQQTKFGLDLDDDNELESPEEHDDIIEQIKREIKNVRTGGLPTISEEDQSESTKMVENLKLKPLKIEEKLEYKDRIAEIQKVYKSYVEKMRKLDILNNQTMHAIGKSQVST